MYNRRFFQTKLGQAAIASTTAMIAFVVLTTQVQPQPAMAMTSSQQMVQLA